MTTGIPKCHIILLCLLILPQLMTLYTLLFSTIFEIYLPTDMELHILFFSLLDGVPWYNCYRADLSILQHWAYSFFFFFLFPNNNWTFLYLFLGASMCQFLGAWNWVDESAGMHTCNFTSAARYFRSGCDSFPAPQGCPMSSPVLCDFVCSFFKLKILSPVQGNSSPLIYY